MSLSNLTFKNINENLVVSGTLTMVSTQPEHKLDLTNTETSDVYIFASQPLYASIQHNVGNFPANKRIVRICDYEGNEVTFMPAKRSRNRCGTIPITISKRNFMAINIPESKISPDSEYFIDMFSYLEFESCRSVNLRKKLITMDLFEFANKYRAININCIFSSQVYNFIKDNFKQEQIPDNINIIDAMSYDITCCIVCEEIFGRVINQTSSVVQGEMCFRNGAEVLQPKFIAGNLPNVSFDMRAHSFHYTGSGSTDFVAIFSCPSQIQTLKITNSDESHVLYEEEYMNNSELIEDNINKLVQYIDVYQQFNEVTHGMNKSRIHKFLAEHSSDIFSVVFDSVSFDMESIKSTHDNIVVKQINASKIRLQQLFTNVITNDYSKPENPIKKQRAIGFMDRGEDFMMHHHLPYEPPSGVRLAAFTPSLAASCSITGNNMTFE